jgi:hypothetical protein
MDLPLLLVAQQKLVQHPTKEEHSEPAAQLWQLGTAAFVSSSYIWKYYFSSSHSLESSNFSTEICKRKAN